MDRSETLKIMAVLRAGYPQYYGKQSADDVRAAVQLWQTIFACDSYEAMNAAVLAYISSDESGYPPNPGKIKAMLRKVTGSADMTPMEAWGLVRKALRNSGYESGKEFAKLPKSIQAVLGSSARLRDWCMIDEVTLENFTGPRFMTSYKEIVEQYREHDMLPEAVKVFIGGLNMKQLTE